MESETHKADILAIDEAIRDHRLERLAQVQGTRINGAFAIALDKLKLTEDTKENTMPAVIEAVAAYATIEKICMALRNVYGIY